MTDRARSIPEAPRFVIDARYVEPKPSGIGRYTEALIERLPLIDPTASFQLWTHPARPRPVAFDNVTCTPVAAGSDGLRTLLTPSWLGSLRDHDVIHFPFSLLGRGLPCATVVTIHDLAWLETPELMDGRPLMRRIRHHYYKRGMRFALDHATRIISVSEATAARIRALAPERAERVRVTYNAAEAMFVPPADPSAVARAAAAVVGSFAPYYVVVGKSEPYKGHEVAIRAFAEAGSDDELLVLIQRAGSGSHLRKLAEQLGIGARLRFLPAVSGAELVTLLQGARALLQPSVMEGFGIPALEAMACGCPVVASDTPALLEVMGGAGLHAPVGDHLAMAQALNRLRANGVADDLRARGLARAKTFSWERTAEATLAVYREAAAEGAADRMKSA